VPHIFGDNCTFPHVHVQKPTSLCIILSYIRTEGRTGKIKHFRNNIYIARLSRFVVCFPASRVLSDIYVNCIKVQGEKKL